MFKKKLGILLTTISILALSTSIASAKASAIVITGNDGKAYEYNYEDLKSSATASVLGDKVNGALYKNFIENKVSIVAYYDDVRKVYVSSEIVNQEAVNKSIAGKRFDLAAFLENTNTVSTAITTTKVIKDSNGNINVDGKGTNTTSISSISNITFAVNQNNSYKVPTVVKATMSDGTTKFVSVTWDDKAYAWNNQVDTRKAGQFTFNGTVSGYSGVVILTLNVYEDMSSILKAYYGTYDVSTNSMMNLFGNTYWHGYRFNPNDYPSDPVWCSFDLGGRYNHISALIGVDDNALCDGEIDMTVYGDCKVLVPTYKLIKRDYPQKLELDVTGVKQLKFIKSGSGVLDIVNPKIR